MESLDHLVSGYQCKCLAGRGPRGWQLGLGRELWAAVWGEGGGARAGDRERVGAGEGERKER